MYSYEILSEARDQVEGLPSVALLYYAELITFVELTPWDAPPFRDDKPNGNLRKIVFGRAAEGIAVYSGGPTSRRRGERDLGRLSRPGQALPDLSNVGGADVHVEPELGAEIKRHSS